MVAVSFATLANMREVQGQHGPNMCLASSKFLAFKLLGFLDPHRHLRDFMHSGWAASHATLPLANAWGWTMTMYNDDFNREILPAALNDSSAGVKSPDVGNIEVRYDYFHHQTTLADNLIKRGVPLVVGVGLSGLGQDHHVVVVRGADGAIWVVDPWPGAAHTAIKKLPTNFSFGRGQVIELSSGEVHIPCASQVFGYYLPADYESRYVFTVQ